MKDAQDALRLIGLEDFLIVEQIEAVAIVVQQPLLHGVGNEGDFDIPNGVVFEADVLRSCQLQVDPLLKLLFGQLTGVGADGISLLDRGEKQLSGLCGFTEAGLAGEDGHRALRQTADDLIEGRDRGFDARDHGWIIRRDIRQLNDPFDGDRRGFVVYGAQDIRAVKVEDFIRVFARFAIRSIGVFFHDHAARFVQPADDIPNHLAAGFVVVPEEDDRLEAFEPIPAMVDPVEIIAPAGYGDDVADARLIQRERVHLTFCDDQRLGKGTHVHAKKNRAGVGSLPFLEFARFGFVRRAIFHIDQRIVPIEREHDVAVVVAANVKSLKRGFADLSSLKVGDDLVGQRLDRRRRLRILLFCLGGRTENLRLLAKACRKLFKPAANATGTTLADIDALSEIQRKGALVRVFAAVANGAELGNQFVSPHRVGGLVLVRKGDHDLTVVHGRSFHCAR